MAKYRLLSGKHAAGRDQDHHAVVFVPGDVIETDQDLLKHNNGSSAPKFERLPDGDPTPASAPRKAEGVTLS